MKSKQLEKIKIINKEKIKTTIMKLKGKEIYRNTIRKNLSEKETI